MDGAGGVEGFLRGAGRGPGAQECVFVVLLAFVHRYNRTARPFNWKFSADDPTALLRRTSPREQVPAAPARQRRPRLPAAGLADLAERYDDQVAARVSAQQRRDELTRALAGLPKGERAVVLLVALAEFSHDEVAQALGISYGAVASRLSRARAKLRRSLATIPAATGKE